MKSPLAHLVNHNLISTLIVVLSLFCVVSGNLSHCNDHKFANAMSTSYMQFTKETVSEEYAIEGEFKSLHCCAKGYRSIEW